MNLRLLDAEPAGTRLREQSAGENAERHGRSKGGNRKPTPIGIVRTSK
jgi:hypothetical protein